MFENKTAPIPGPGTVVGANVKLTGTLKDINDIIIHGAVEGDVISEKNVLIAETAKVKGPIKALTINISGEVNGEVTANEKLEIQPTGKISGSIITKSLTIKPGAVFNGKCAMEISQSTLPSKDKIKNQPQAQSEISKSIMTPKEEKSVEFEME